MNKMKKYRPNHVDETMSRAHEYRDRKQKRKKTRTILEAAILLLIAFVFAGALFLRPAYVPSEGAAGAEDQGFVAISYFGVEKYASDSSTLIYQQRLEEHIKALKASGFETISQQDIIDYYGGKKKLPEKALFLMLEDGRRDTAVFASDIFRKYNYLSTVLTYADKFEKNDPKFLSPKDIKSLLDSTFFEVGSNGYRLEYINVFDRYGNYFGNLNSNEFVSVNQYLVRDYNHYLMDYIRDEDRLKIESNAQLRQRISSDYDSMEYVYTQKLGFVPELYAIMHSNTGMFATNEDASAVNRENLERLFGMNFNREGSCMNTRASSIYDLTRMQPQANWYSNHLLMRIWDDTGAQVRFVTGDEREAEKWSCLSGAAEYKDNKIVLTSAPDAYGRAVLTGARFGDIRLSVTLDGNKAGNQGFYLRADDALQSGLYVGIENNVLCIRELTNGAAKELYSLDLFSFDGGATQSAEENEREGLVALQNALLTYDRDYNRLQNAQAALELYKAENVLTLSEGGESYVPPIEITEKASRALEITLVGNTVTVSVDGRAAIKNLKTAVGGSGALGLEASALIQDRYSQRNLADDVYDAVFTDLSVSDAGNAGTVYYAYVLNGWDKLLAGAGSIFRTVANFFITTF